MCGALGAPSRHILNLGNIQEVSESDLCLDWERVDQVGFATLKLISTGQTHTYP